MSENIEIEFKNLLIKEEYRQLLKIFQISKSLIKTQINHYFDTPGFSLKAEKMALRVREKEDQYELTLKQPATIGLLETNQILQTEAAKNFIKQGVFPEGLIKEKLFSQNIAIEQIKYFGTLITNRAEINYHDGLLVFDHSSYLNIEDFELEYEVKDAEKGKEIFKSLLSKLNIPPRKTENKIQRFYNQKQKEVSK